VRIVVALLLVLFLCLPVLPAEFVADEFDFTCLRDQPKVRNFRVTHHNERKLKKALRVARRGKRGRRYPVGTIIQLVPFEAMVKRGGGFNPDGDGWEFFRLQVSAAGTVIPEGGRGGAEVTSFGLSGSNCQGCHAAARRHDFVCERTHGCVTLPAFVTPELIAAVQENDPRCPPAP
jgi:hypothetical protein